MINKMTLNRNQLKYIAAFAMLIDHVGMMFISVLTPLGALCRIVGRLTAPIMCMFLAEGYRYTKSKARYGLRLFVFALISQPVYAAIHGNDLFVPDFNMIFTLFLSFMALLCFDKIKLRPVALICSAAFIALSYWGDWGLTAPAWVLCFYIFGNDRKKTVVAFSAVAFFWILRVIFNSMQMGYNWYGEFCQLGLFLFPFMFCCYNGEKGGGGKFSKWFFYIFYPLHLFALMIIDGMI